ncbi:adenylyl-sulfate kinase [Mongoliitalea lutea]|uniref:Adenylyl-sulfate kinase n=1 Tax=Mongoliitalea lutea TaxID=849756 RepID=A0A8J3CWN9_9BACT|nr:adenylyl-sulfate kinase [Mongoliitalea lutea]GHB36925.1 adenylyl-sulfate kinase [Mongoliitalea lutea]
MKKPILIWFTGLSGSGKSTLAAALQMELQQSSMVYLLDGDALRKGLNKDLGFSDKDRHENIRRTAELAKILLDTGMTVLAAFITPFESDRVLIRSTVGEERFVEVFVDAPLSICEKRDVKGLYALARAGKINQFTGISSPYETPSSPHIHLKTAENSVNECIQKILAYLEP